MHWEGWRDSPAPACVPCPQPQHGWIGLARSLVSPRLPWPRVPVAGMDVSIPNQCHWECRHPVGSERLEVAAQLSSASDPQQGCRYPPSPSFAGFRTVVFPCTGNSALGRGKTWWQQRDAPRGGGFPKEMRLRSHPRANPAASQCRRCQCTGRGMGLCVVPFQGCTGTNPTSGTLC